MNCVRPTVSVIIPTFNRAEMVADSILSVLNQTYGDLELIVVDDYSTDATFDMVKGFSDPRVSYVLNQGKKGAAGARNYGFGKARGRYVALLDSDDLWKPRKLEMQIPLLDEDGMIGVAYAGWQWVDWETGRTRIVRRPDDAGRIEGLPRWFYNLCQDIVVRRELTDRIRYDESLPTYLDLDWMIRLAGITHFEPVGEVLVECRDHSGPRNSDGALVRVQVLERVVRTHAAFIRRDAVAWREMTLKLGAALLALRGDRRTARSYLYASIQSGSTNARALLYATLASIPGGNRILSLLPRRRS